MLRHQGDPSGDQHHQQILRLRFIKQHLEAAMWIRIDCIRLRIDLDPQHLMNTDPDPDPVLIQVYKIPKWFQN